MKNLLISILKYIINRVKRNRLVQFAFETPMDESKFHKTGTFTDSQNNRFILYKEVRDLLKPGWQNYVRKLTGNITETDLPKPSAKGRLIINRIEPLIHAMGKKIENSRILEIGCHEGHVSYALAEKGAKEVTGTEYIEYKVSSESDDRNDLKSDELSKLQQNAATAYHIPKPVKFVNDDICNTILEPESFDIILSFDVFEHLHNPSDAFENISKLLKPGGISIQEYNPFFSLIGGHSLCTLDFFWGHARLSEKDFLKYINDFRPAEFEYASAFYRFGINRMTLNDLKKYCEQSDLITESIILYSKEEHQRMLTKEILEQCKGNYPGVQINDLITPRVIVIQRKPD